MVGAWVSMAQQMGTGGLGADQRQAGQAGPATTPPLGRVIVLPSLAPVAKTLNLSACVCKVGLCILDVGEERPADAGGWIQLVAAFTREGSTPINTPPIRPPGKGARSGRGSTRERAAPYTVGASC